MFKRLSLVVALLASLPSLALAQSAAPAPVCDGSEMRHAEHTRSVGRAMFASTAVADLVAILTIPRDPAGVSTARSHLGFVAATVPVALAGTFIARRGYPGDSFWRRVVTRLKVGETRAADVQLCLHRPLVASRGTTQEEWTYLIARPSVLGGTLRTLRLTFRDSVLANVEQTEVTPTAIAASPFDSNNRLDRHRGFCVPPTTVSPDPFPTPTDTTAAAAAMARAQAFADAAMKNAAASAAYAACMASDTAP